MTRTSALALLCCLATGGLVFVLMPSSTQMCARDAVANGAEAADAVRRCGDLYRLAELRSR